MFELAGLGLGLIGGIGKMFGRGKANKKLEQLQAQDPVYKENPLARQRLGLASTLLNARMPGAAAAENNIYRGGANAMYNAQRNATDSSQLLGVGAAIQGQEGQQFQDLQQQEAQDYQRRYGNLVGAQQGVINEGDKVFQDQTRRFQDKLQIQGAKNENNQNTWGDISNLGFGLADFGMAQQNGQQGAGGGFSNLFGGGNNRTMADMPRNFYNPQRLNYYGNGG